MNISENAAPFTGSTAEFSGESTLAVVLQRLSSQIHQQGRIIKAVTLNGQPVSLETIPADLKIHAGDQLDLVTDTPHNIAQDTLQEALGQLASFESVLDQIIDDMIKGEREQSFSRFQKFLEEFRQIIALLQTLETTFSLDYTALRYEGDKSVLDFSQNLVSVLQSTKEAMTNEDLVTLTDLLEYEIKPLFQGELKQVLIMLYDTLRKG